MALQAIQIHFDAGIQFDCDRIAELARVDGRVSIGRGRPTDFVDLSGLVQDAFAEQESGCQLEVVPGGAHRDGDGPVAQANFERIFDGQQVLECRGGIAFDFLDGYGEDGPVHTDFMVTR